MLEIGLFVFWIGMWGSYESIVGDVLVGVVRVWLYIF